MSTTDDHARWITIDNAIEDFDRYLITGKNASAMTRQCYIRHARAFLDTVTRPSGTLDLDAVSGPQVRSYVTDLSRRYSPQSCKLKATVLRCFLRFAWMSGRMRSNLAGAVGTVITHRSGKIPKALHPDELARLLATPDRRTLGGARDYALLILMSRLGLRAGEVGGLRLDDIDWAHAHLRVRVKGGNVLELPIPDDVGSALVEYLHRRPTPTPHREVFLTNYGTAVPMTRGAVTAAVARNARTAGLGTIYAHRLRHSAARAVLAGGGTFEEVGELLGHATRQVTMAYSSFDLTSMRVDRRPPVAGQGAVMPDWAALIDEYLAFRIARGFQPSRKIQRLLPQFVASLPHSRDDSLLFSNSDVLTWANAPDRAAPSWVSARLSIVRGFALYLAGSGLPVVVPACRQAPTSSRRATPYLYSTSQIVDLMDAADVVFTPLRAATMRTLIGLLFVTGMRIGETLHLSIGGLDTEQNTLMIRHAKLGRERIVCLDTSTTEALQVYLDDSPRHGLGTGADRPLFVTGRGTAVSYSTVCGGFGQLVRRVGLVRRAGARPRLHDLRHSFATRAMIDAYRTGRDPAHTLTVLSFWLGHSNPVDTYWYLQAAPEVAAIAARRLDHGQEW